VGRLCARCASETARDRCVCARVIPALVNLISGGGDAAGPADPELGRVLRPASLRARFGVDTVKNALHVTDLEGDAPLEVAFFFGARR
jgi:nucleoside diphosphate kinase